MNKENPARPFQSVDKKGKPCWWVLSEHFSEVRLAVISKDKQGQPWLFVGSDDEIYWLGGKMDEQTRIYLTAIGMVPGVSVVNPDSE